MADRGSNELRGTAMNPGASSGLQSEASLHLRSTSSESQWRKTGKGCVSPHHAAKGIRSMAAVTSIPPWRILQAFLSLLAVAGRYALQSFEPADNS